MNDSLGPIGFLPCLCVPRDISAQSSQSCGHDLSYHPVIRSDVGEAESMSTTAMDLVHTHTVPIADGRRGRGRCALMGL